MITPVPSITRRQAGVGLIEVLVAALVLAIGVLGFVGMQLKSVRVGGDSHARVQAVSIAQDLIERITMNTSDQAQSGYAVALSANSALAVPQSLPTTCQGTQTCTASEMVTFDLGQVAYQAANMLPGGLVSGRVAASGSRNIQIFVAWGGTQPSVGSGSTACMVRDSTGILTYKPDANCVMLEATFQ